MLSSRRISSLSPLAEKISTTSPWRIEPRSPCTASAGERKWLGVPVLESVAEIFHATCPALPTPQVNTDAGQSRINRTARSKCASTAAATDFTAAASVSITCRANFWSDSSICLDLDYQLPCTRIKQALTKDGLTHGVSRRTGSLQRAARPLAVSD